MSTAFGIFLFLIAYGPVAYLIYNDVTGRRSGARPQVARGAGGRGTDRLQLHSHYQY
jgi:hypothetical protein